MNKLIGFLTGKLGKKDAQVVGIQKEVKTLQLESLLELRDTLNSSEWTDSEFKDKFLDELKNNILKHENEISALEKKLSREERKEIRDWHCVLKSFVFKN